MWGWLPGRLLSGPFVGSGPAGGLLSRKAGWLTVSREVCSRGWLVAWCVWCRKHACSGGLLWPCGCGGLLVVGAPACLGVCGGGMLSGFWGSAPWLPDPCSAACLWVVGLGVGGLVVNCIVDASILL